MNDVAITVDQVSKRFRWHRDKRHSLKELVFRGRPQEAREFWALRDVSLEIPRGTTFGLVGHNGSGKSTLLKLLAGIHRPTSGLITTSVGRVSALLELGAGFHPELSGRENIYLNGAILGLTRRQIDAAMEAIIDFAGLPDGFIDAPVKVYSSGMYVRLGFSIAVTVEPEILLVDEIVAVGDEEFQRRCFDHLHELRKRGTTIVLVTHAMALIENLCDEAAWLDHGRLRQVGDARSVVRGYLDEVNEHEAEVASAAGTDLSGAAPETPDGVRRLGTGEVRVTGLEYLDGRGSSASVLVAGEPATFRIHYQADQPVAEPVFGLAFIHESGVNVAGPNSGGGPGIAEVRGEGYVDFHVPSLILLPGVFEVSTAIIHKGHTYDYAERAFDLRVRGSGTEEPGLVRVTGDWTVGSNGVVHDLPPVSDARS